MLKPNVLRLPTPFFRPFPDLEDVLADDAKNLSRWILPAATVTLDSLDDHLTGKLHFVVAVDHWTAEHGDRTARFHTRFCTTGWIGWNVDDQSRYSLAAPDQFFFDADDYPDEDRTEDRKIYADAHKTYAQTKARFLENGFIPGFRNTPDELAYLGGRCGWPKHRPENY